MSDWENPDNWDKYKNKVENKDKDKNKERRHTLRAFGLFMQLGINMAACVLVGFAAGRFLDGLTGIFPALTLIFSFLGLGAALKLMYDIVKDWD
ncbi:MAG: AtpZ/AtpI family protein [Oscillospiraceae bacterium]|nr:AtpZ/AtpI family protein [Oscillospiraceae bacterium]